VFEVNHERPPSAWRFAMLYKVWAAAARGERGRENGREIGIDLMAWADAEGCGTWCEGRQPRGH